MDKGINLANYHKILAEILKSFTLAQDVGIYWDLEYPKSWIQRVKFPPFKIQVLARCCFTPLSLAIFFCILDIDLILLKSSCCQKIVHNLLHIPYSGNNKFLIVEDTDATTVTISVV